MKVSETKYECDFCAEHFPFLIPINDGLWVICRNCFDHVYGDREERAALPEWEEE